MDNMESLQRKHIPVNIVICVLSLIAAFTLIFAPLITIDLGKAANEISSMMFETDESEGSESSDSGDAIMKVVVDLMGNFKIRLSTYSIGKFAFADKPMGIVADAVADEISKAQDDIIGTILSEALPAIVAETNLGIDATKVDAKELVGKLDAVFSADSEESQEAAIDELIDSMQSQLVSTEGEPLITDEMKENLSGMISDMMAKVRESMGDDVTLESFICVTISQMMFGDKKDGSDGTNNNPDGDSNNGDSDPDSDNSDNSGSVDNGNGGDSDGNSGKIYTNYNDLFAALLGTNGEDGDGSSMMDGVTDALEPIIGVLKYFVYFMIFISVLWFLQAGFAVMRIFTKNKKCRMWYTKLFGFLPCLIFGVLPLIGKAVLASMIPEFAGILNAYSSTTWISGACVIALWGITIFWAGPINRKIRKLREQGAGAGESSAPSGPSVSSDTVESSDAVASGESVVEVVESVESGEPSNSDEQ